MAIEFTSVLTQADGMSATGIPIPDAVVAELAAGKNPPVTVEVRRQGDDADWYTYRTSIATRNGGYIMSFSSANRAASGLVAAAPLDVRVTHDTAPRIIELPEDLKTALIASRGLDRFLALSYSKQRGYVEPVEAAKAVDTRRRRVEKIAEEFSADTLG